MPFFKLPVNFSGFIQIYIAAQCQKDNGIFVAQTLYKKNPSKRNFQTFEMFNENSPNSYVIFEIKSQFFFNPNLGGFIMGLF